MFTGKRDKITLKMKLLNGMGEKKGEKDNHLKQPHITQTERQLKKKETPKCCLELLYYYHYNLIAKLGDMNIETTRMYLAIQRICTKRIMKNILYDFIVYLNKNK